MTDTGGNFLEDEIPNITNFELFVKNTAKSKVYHDIDTFRHIMFLWYCVKWSDEL